MMRAPVLASVGALLACLLVPTARADGQPKPGTTGNPANVPYIGKADPKGNPVRLAKASGHVSNYNESKVPAYTLPDPLVMASGERVTTAQQWREKRRPEILKFYQTEIYGRIPANTPKVTWEVTETDSAARDGAAIMKRVVGRMGDKHDGPKMNLTVHMPAKASGPTPMLLSISFGFPPGGRGAKAGPPPYDALGELLRRG